MASLIASMDVLKFVRHCRMTRDKRQWKCVRDNIITYLVLAAFFYCFLADQLEEGEKVSLGEKNV